jgi:hypothetical protein
VKIIANFVKVSARAGAAGDRIPVDTGRGVSNSLFVPGVVP